MPIQFQCPCGTVLKTSDEHAGKQATCPQCGQRLFVPPPLQLQARQQAAPEAADAGQRIACPNCGLPVTANAVVCVHCGLNAKTGKVTATKVAPAARSRGLPLGLPVGKIAAAAAAGGVLGVGWFCVASPMLARLNVGEGVGYVTNGDLDRAVACFQALRPKVGEQQRQRVDLWLEQLDQELERNTKAVLSQGKLVRSDAVRMNVVRKPFSGGAMMARVELTNTSDEPITVCSDHFYLRGLSDIVLPASHADSTLDRLTVEPGATEGGLIAFRKLPDHPVQRRIGRQEQSAYYLMFNDGGRYVKCMLPY